MEARNAEEAGGTASRESAAIFSSRDRSKASFLYSLSELDTLEGWIRNGARHLIILRMDWVNYNWK